MRYVKKPIIIEATVYQPGKGMEDGMDFDENHNMLPFIKTLEGKMFISQGDFIVTGVKGERYPCKGEIFRETYRPVDSEEFLE